MYASKNILSATVSYLCLIPTVMVLCTALIIDPSIVQGIVAGQAFWFYKVLPFAAVATAISFIINRKRIRFSVIDLMVVLFFASGVLVTWMITKELSYRTDIVILIVCFYFQLRVVLGQRDGTPHILFLAFMTVGLIEALWGLRQLYGYEISQHPLFKTTGSFYNSGPYAGFVAMVMPVALYYSMRYWHLLKERFDPRCGMLYGGLALSAVTFICILVVLPATQSRASWIAACLGCGCVFLCQKAVVEVIRRQIKKVALILPVALVILLLTSYGLYSFKEDSADGRKLIWKNTISMIQDNPWGVGLGHYSGEYGKYQADYFGSGKGSKQDEKVAGSPEYAFNEYLQICAEYGIIPFVLFLVIIIYSIVIAVRKKRFAALGGLIALQVFAGMSYPFSLVPFIVAWIFLIVMCSYPQVEEKKNLSPITLLLLLLIIGTSTFIAFKKRETYQAFKDWGKCKMLHTTKSYSTAHKEYEKLYPYLKNHHTFLFEYGQILSNTEHYEQGNEVLKRACEINCDPMFYNLIGKNYQSLKAFPEAEKYFIQAINIIPHRLYPHYLLTQMYMEQGRTEEAKKAANRLLELDVKITSPATKKMQAEIKQLLDSLKSENKNDEKN